MSAYWSPRSSGLRRGFQRAAYPDHLVALDFIHGLYRHGSRLVSAVADVPGYSFSDSVDNLPNIDGTGYTALSAESSKLAFSSPIAADADFILWAVGPQVNDAAGHVAVDLNAGTTANRYTIQRSTANLPQATITTGSVLTSKSGTALADGRATILLRREAGNLSVCTKAPDGTVTIGVAGAVTDPVGTLTVLRIGVSIASTSYHQTAIEFVGMKLGAFSDADITALLTAA